MNGSHNQWEGVPLPPPKRKSGGAIAADELTAMRQRVERLEAALRPFAEFCERFDGCALGLAAADDEQIYCFHGTNGEAVITLGHCRRARQALEPT